MVLFHRYNPRWMLLYLRGAHEIDSPTAPRPLCPLRLRAAHSTHDFANRGEGEEKKKKESTLFSFSLRTACALLSFPREEGRHTTILSSCTKRSSGGEGYGGGEREKGAFRLCPPPLHSLAGRTQGKSERETLLPLPIFKDETWREGRRGGEDFFLPCCWLRV